MNCYKCRREITEYELQWTTRGDKGRRHLTCPNPKSQGAKEKRRRLEQLRRAVQK
jgi:hypothetical protein